jgi:hypothetical protein
VVDPVVVLEFSKKDLLSQKKKHDFFRNELDTRAVINTPNPANRRANNMIEIMMQQGRQTILRLGI